MIVLCSSKGESRLPGTDFNYVSTRNHKPRACSGHHPGIQLNIIIHGCRERVWIKCEANQKPASCQLMPLATWWEAAEAVQAQFYFVSTDLYFPQVKRAFR